MSFLEYLIQNKILKKDQAELLERGMEKSKSKLEELILKDGLVPEDRLFSLKSKFLNIPLKKVKATDVPLETLEIIPEDSAAYYKAIPLFKKGNLLEIGMIYPENLRAQEALKFLARERGFSYNVFLINFSTFNDLLGRYKSLKQEIQKALGELDTELKGETKAKTRNVNEIGRMASEAPISRIVAVILRQAVDKRASDIHIEPAGVNLRVRLRIDGVLHSSINLPAKVHSAVVARIKILSNLRIDETRIPQDGRFSIMMGGRNIDFRVSTFPTAKGEIVELRVLDPKEGVKSFDELGIRGPNYRIIHEMAAKPFGMILSTGPTGSGKTTTLYAILRFLNKVKVNIMTLEDPVEYVIPGINQSQIKPGIGYTFASGLRYMLRHDPDIVMVGEIRDSDTASLATHAALTGHLVLSTVHTNNAIGAIPRLIDLGVEPFLLNSTINAIISQRLVRHLCVDSREKIRPNVKTRDLIFSEIEKLPNEVKKENNIPQRPGDIWIWKPKISSKCKSGYLGRIGLFEVLRMTDQLSDIILTRPSKVNISAEAKRQQMVSMRQDGILKVLKGETSIEEVLAETEREYQ